MNKYSEKAIILSFWIVFVFLPGLDAHALISLSRIYVESAASEHSNLTYLLTGIEFGKLTHPVIV